jgi:polyisoprenoid-binding protein YceI
VARLRANRFLMEGGRLAAVEGELTLHGVTQPLRLQAERFRCGEVSMFGIRRQVCGGDFRAEVPRSAFGMTRFLPDVGDTVTLQVSVEASPAGNAPQ